jgi:hypothetical protein
VTGWQALHKVEHGSIDFEHPADLCLADPGKTRVAKSLRKKQRNSRRADLGSLPAAGYSIIGMRVIRIPRP